MSPALKIVRLTISIGLNNNSQLNLDFFLILSKIFLRIVQSTQGSASRTARRVTARSAMLYGLRM